MGFGAVAEPLIVVTLLFGGTWVNRQRNSPPSPHSKPYHSGKRDDSLLESGQTTPTSSSGEESQGFLNPYASQQTQDHAEGWRKREVGILGWRREVWSPDTKVFEERLLSRLLRAFPFLVEVWYWALIYWVGEFHSLMHCNPAYITSTTQHTNTI